MRKKLLFLLLALSLCLSLHVTALAHPGNTSDDDGGHIDNSTGEYHYHHGYSAHSHYDMDGDGDIDCPYDFIDKTGQNSGTPSTSSESEVDSAIPADNLDSNDSAPSTFNRIFQHVLFVGLIIVKIVCYLFLTLLALAFLRFIFDAPIRFLTCRYRKLSKQQTLFVNARRYARLSISAITREFNDVFYTEYRDHELKCAYYKSIENSIYINAPVDSIMIDFIDFFLFFNASWLDIAVLVNQHFHSCYGPNDLKAKYSEQSSKLVPTRNTTQHLLVADEDGFLKCVPSTPTAVQPHDNQTDESSSLCEEQFLDAITEWLYGNKSD